MRPKRAHARKGTDKQHSTADVSNLLHRTRSAANKGLGSLGRLPSQNRISDSKRDCVEDRFCTNGRHIRAKGWYQSPNRWGIETFSVMQSWIGQRADRPTIQEFWGEKGLLDDGGDAEGAGDSHGIDGPHLTNI
jgi:hypothetical protein